MTINNDAYNSNPAEPQSEVPERPAWEPPERPGMNWRQPTLFGLGALVVVLLAGGAYYIGLSRGQPLPQGNTASQPAQSPSQSAAPKLKAVTGVPPTVMPTNNTWPQYQNSVIGLTLRYPPGWKYVEEPQQSGVKLYPPDSDPTHPSPMILFDFAPDYPYNPNPTPTSHTTQPQPITVSGIAGRQYEDTEFDIPDQNFSIELPYRTGSILITATKGPYVNLVPQLQEILKTVILQP